MIGAETVVADHQNVIVSFRLHRVCLSSRPLFADAREDQSVTNEERVTFEQKKEETIIFLLCQSKAGFQMGCCSSAPQDEVVAPPPSSPEIVQTDSQHNETAVDVVVEASSPTQAAAAPSAEQDVEVSSVHSEERGYSSTVVNPLTPSVPSPQDDDSEFFRKDHAAPQSKFFFMVHKPRKSITVSNTQRRRSTIGR